LAHTSLTGVAAVMWNHAPEMLHIPPPLSDDEMWRIVSYAWA